MTQEIRLVERIVKLLESENATAIKTHGSSMRQGEPDIFCCMPYLNIGITVVIEVKQPGKFPRELQMARIRRWAKSGAIAFWTSDPDEVLGIIGHELLARREGNTILKEGRPVV